MAIPVGVLATLGELATNSKVQEFAGRIASDVYGRIMPSKQATAEVEAHVADKAVIDESALLIEISAKLEAIPTRDEMVASFAVLQAELDRQHRKTRLLLWAVAGLCLTLGAVVIALLVGAR